MEVKYEIQNIKIRKLLLKSNKQVFAAQVCHMLYTFTEYLGLKRKSICQFSRKFENHAEMG
jgi:hypothetical protein